jgi:16S rRNA processing protein RimM
VAGRRSQAPVTLTIDVVRGDEAFPIVLFEGVTDRTGAEALRGYVLLVPASELPPLSDDEYYPFDLLGLPVYDEEGAARGVVTDAVESPAHWMLIVRGPAQGADLAKAEVGSRAGVAGETEWMVPFVHEAVPEIDLEKRRIVVVSRFLL